MKKKALLFAGIGVAVIFIGIAGYSTQAGTVETVAEIEEPETSPSPTPVPSPTPMPTEEPAKEKQEDEESGNLLVSEEVALIELDEFRYATTNVSLREKASVGSEKLGTVATATKVHVNGITEDGQWCSVDGVNGKDGFISAAYLQDTAPTQQQQQAIQQQQQQQADLEQQATQNEQQSQDFKAAVEAYKQSIGGGTNINNLPTQEYQGNQYSGTYGDVHAE